MVSNETQFSCYNDFYHKTCNSLKCYEKCENFIGKTLNYIMNVKIFLKIEVKWNTTRNIQNIKCVPVVELFKSWT